MLPLFSTSEIVECREDIAPFYRKCDATNDRNISNRHDYFTTRDHFRERRLARDT